MLIYDCTMMQFAVALPIASVSPSLNISRLTLVSSVLAPDMKHEYRRNEQKRHDQHWHGSPATKQFQYLLERY